MVTARRRAVAWPVVVSLATTAWWAYQSSPPGVLAQGTPGTQLSVYSRQASYSAPLVDLGGQTYIGLVELLEPLGTVEARVDGKKFKLRFSAPGSREIELQFQDGKNKGKAGGESIKLPANFIVQTGHGYVPVAAIGDVLFRTLNLPIRLNLPARRLFIGDVAKRFTLDLRTGPPSKLFVSFDVPVNPTIATEPGHIRFTFRRDPVLPSTEQASYSDPLITGARFTEHDGVGELDVTGTTPLMANFADGGKTIVITAAPAPPPPVSPQIAAPAPVIPPPPQSTPTQPRPSGPPRFFVLIDPAHGGADIGAAITKDLPEKDVVLALARRLQRELESRGIPSILLRTADVAISLDQRAVSANGSRTGLYVSLHAANTGNGVHVFTSMIEANNAGAREFLSWEQAQSGSVEASTAVANAVIAELVSRKLPNSLIAAPLRPLNNIAAPSIAVEIASPTADVSDIAKPAYQTEVAQAIADGIAASRNKNPGAKP